MPSTNIFAEDNPTKRDVIAAHQLSVWGSIKIHRMGSFAFRTSRQCLSR
jgi:hypothetical protein